MEAPASDDLQIEKKALVLCHLRHITMTVAIPDQTWDRGQDVSNLERKMFRSKMSGPGNWQLL